MPLIVSEIDVTEARSGDFANLLKADPEISASLSTAAEQGAGRLFLGVFNARPVALLRAVEAEQGWRLADIVVHPATRGRGVGKELVCQTARLLAPAQLDSGPDWTAGQGLSTGPQ
jgi:ribosomal protein S18 acetylase RimI-like enzyme